MKFKLLLLLVSLLIILTGCSDVSDVTIDSETSTSETIVPQKVIGEKNILKEIKNEAVTHDETPISKNQIAIFYRTVLSDVSDRLIISSNNPVTGEGYTTNVNWEKTDKGVVRYLPSEDRFDVMGTTTSYYYSKGSISPLTIGDRLFLVRVRASASTLTEIDPMTSKTISTIPIEDTGFAIVGDNVYYREGIRNDLFDKRTGGGELMVHNLKEISPKQLLDYGELDNKGEFYGTADSLISVVHDFESKTDTIRKHNTETGRMESVIQTNIPTGSYIQAEDALYQVIRNGDRYKINQIQLSGNIKTIIEVDLDPDEKGISVDVYGGRIFLVSYGNDFKVKNIKFFNIETGIETEITTKSSFGSVSSQDYQFLVI